jgi:thioredoxin 1
MSNATNQNATVLHLDESNFETRTAHGLTLVDFWAPWCGPCRMMSPVLDELAGELAGRVRVVKVNVEDSPRLAARFRVQGIPLLVVLSDGEEVTRLVGLRSKHELLKLFR